MTPEQREQVIEKIAKWQWARDGYPREMVTNRDPGNGYYFAKAEALYDGALAPLLAEERRAGAELSNAIVAGIVAQAQREAAEQALRDAALDALSEFQLPREFGFEVGRFLTHRADRIAQGQT